MLDRVVGRVLKETRKEKGLTSVRLAETSGLSNRFLLYVEKGTKSLSVRTLFRLCEALGVRPSEMLHQVELRCKAVYK